MAVFASSLTVTEILSDLELLGDVKNRPAHPLLALGHKLLPNDLQKARDADVDAPVDTRSAHSSGEKLTELLSDIREFQGASSSNATRIEMVGQQAAALRLSHLYVTQASQTIALNGSGAEADRTVATSSSSFNLPSAGFEKLHRRVARLQAIKDAELRQLEQTQRVIQSTDTAG